MGKYNPYSYAYIYALYESQGKSQGRHDESSSSNYYNRQISQTMCGDKNMNEKEIRKNAANKENWRAFVERAALDS